MSSRLLRAGDSGANSGDAAPPAVTQMIWRQAGVPIAPTVRARTGAGGGEPDAAELERQIEQRIKTAYRQGCAAGEAAAAQQASERLEPVLAALNGIVHELAGARKRFRVEAEEDTVKLAIAIARRVLYRELSTDPEAILGLVIAAFQKLNARETHRLRVSPVDAPALEENRARLELTPGLEIAPDASLARGSAIFETSRGELDASVDTQLAEIQRGLADVMRRRAK
jgi:flagellar assembly protein FliH